MADPVSAGLIIGSTALSMYSQSQAANAQEEALKIRQQQERIAAKNRSLQREQSLLQVLSTQRSMAGARGVIGAGGSFQAIQQGAFQQFDQDERADALNTSYNEQYLAAEGNIARTNANMNMMNSLFKAGGSLFNINGTY